MGGQNEQGLLDVFRKQAGIISAKQAAALGMSRRQIRYRVQQKEWEPLRRGIYHHRLFDENELMWLHAVSLGGYGYASHRYAARLHQLEPYSNAVPEATVRRSSFTRTPSIRLHESTQVATANLGTINGLPVSSVERTIMDVAAVEHRQWAILAAMDSAALAQKTTAARLAACLRVHARQGRDGTVRFRAAVDAFSSSGAVPIGHASRRCSELLTASGFPSPTFEDRIFVNGQFVAQTDLGWDVPIVAFLDGFTYHAARRAQSNKDRRQRQVLQRAGLVVVEFTNDQLVKSPGYVVATARTAFLEATVRLRDRPELYKHWVGTRRL